MKSFKFLILVWGWALPEMLLAQDLGDLWWYGRPDLAVTARAAGMAGANGSLTGDYGAVLVNPAALGGLRKAALSATLGGRVDRLQNTFLGNETVSGSFRMPLQDISLMLPYRQSLGAWKQVFGFGYSQNRGFAERLEYSGYNAYSTLLWDMAEEVNRTGYLDDTYTGPAYDAYLIGPTDTTPGASFGTVLPGAHVEQKELRERSGRQSELTFHWAANHDNLVQLGLSVGVRTLNHQWRSSYQEVDRRDSTPEFESFEYIRKLDVSGSGLFFRLGVQAQPLAWLRLGLAFSSRGRTALTERYQTLMVANFVDTANILYTLKGYSPDPDTLTPFVWTYKGSNRTTLSASVFWGRSGLLSVDYDLMGYRGMGVGAPLNEGDIDPTVPDWGKDLNREARETFRLGHQVRMGTEWVQGPAVYRMGYAWSSSPYKSELIDPAWNQSRRQFSVGFGRRFGPLMLDFAAVWQGSSMSEQVYPVQEAYLLDTKDQPVLRSTQQSYRFVAGVQYRFGT
jgi:hypothetical protein